MVKYTNINYGISYCFGVHEVVTGAELVFMLHSDGIKNLWWREQSIVMYSWLWFLCTTGLWR